MLNVTLSQIRITISLPVRVVIALLFVFIMLVGFGITGSSLSRGLIDSGVTSDETSFLFKTKPRNIRSDEWLVITPMAIGQLNHRPPFPIINRNLGPDGQNMLIVGMTGVPVAHISTVGKPATWGFFFLGLKQALAWYWWLPIFGSLLSVWGLICVAFRSPWLPGLGIASLIVLSPYVTAWSYWPAYTVMFPSLAVLSILRILQSERPYVKVMWTFFLTLALTGFFLILYPAWQIPLAYLYASIFIAVVIRDRLWKRRGWKLFLLILIAISASVTIVFLWWVDAKDAILSMTSTIYPGQRAEVRGGDMPGWFPVKGLISDWTMFSDISGTNQSESASFIYLFIPSLILLIIALNNPNRDLVLSLAILTFILITLFYQYYGFDQSFAKYSLWGRTTGARSDLALGMAQYFFIATMITYFSKRHVPKASVSKNISAWCISLLSAGATLYWTSNMPPDWVAHPSFRCAQFVALFVSGLGSYFLFQRKFHVFVIVLLSFNVPIALLFNPLLVGPKHISPLPLVESSGEASQFSLGAGERVLVVGSQIPAMMLLASGMQVLNAVNYYPQASIWRALDPFGKDVGLYNRYQHLIFFVRELSGDSVYQIFNPSPDVVQVILDSKQFNFQTLPASHILASARDERDLRENKSLFYIGKIGTMRLFGIVSDVNRSR